VGCLPHRAALWITNNSFNVSDPSGKIGRDRQPLTLVPLPRDFGFIFSR
jgi:hypothetical protein